MLLYKEHFQQLLCLSKVCLLIEQITMESWLHDETFHQAWDIWQHFCRTLLGFYDVIN